MKNKGFTLIELLAVIVILAVISLIAVPMILGVIEDSRKSSFKVTCNEIYDSYEQYEVNEELQGNKAENVIFEFGSNRTEREELDGIIYEPISKLNLKGELPKMGTYKILKNTRELVVSNNQYTCIRDGKRNEVLEGSIADNDITNPILKGISLSSTTNSIQVVVEAEEPDGMIVKYYYKINGEETISESNIQVYKGLEKNKEYEIEVTVGNKSGLKSETIKETITTKEINNPEMKQISETPGGYEYATSRVIQIEYDKQEGLKYYLKSKEEAEVVGNTIVSTCGTETIPGSCTESNVTTIEANTWYEISSPTVSVVYKQNGTLYALTGDGTNTTGASTYTITKIDTSEPNINMSVGGLQTDRAVISAVCSDEESGITKYEYSKDNGTSWVDNGIGTSYTFAGLTKETSYTYKVRCTNGSGMTKDVSETGNTLGMTNPIIKQASQTPSSGYEYATNRVIQITYNNSNINSPIYYFKSSVGAIVSSGVVTGVCGTSTNPGSCTGSNVTTLVANTWYQTSSATPSITYQANGTLYALTSDGTNVSGTSTYTVTKIDTSVPSVPTITYNGGSNSCSWKNNYNITLTSSANSGIHHYEVDWDNDGVVNITTGNNFIPWDGYSSCTTKFRAVSNSGVASEWTDVNHIHMDTSAPGVTTITYNGGSNSCSWKNNYNITLSANDNVGIAYYQIDVDNNGTADATTASNFVPGNGWSTCTARFRAVDHAGNVGEWTENQHIHMDTERPTHTNWWWGEVTKDVARLYIQATDNVGINRVQCPTSTASGSYNNWNWFTATWDSGANAYRCDITPATFGHYNQTYTTHLYIYDHAGNGGYYNATSVAIPARQTRVYLVQNSALCSGVSIGVGQVDDSDRYNWSASGSSINLANNGDDEWEQHAYTYFNKQIPAGKTVHYTVSIQRISGYTQLYNSNFYVYRLTETSNMHNTRKNLTSFSKSSGGNSTVSGTAIVDVNSYIGFFFNAGGSTGGGNSVIRFTINELYYDL